MMSDLDIYRAAKLLIDQHGDGAASTLPGALTFFSSKVMSRVHPSGELSSGRLRSFSANAGQTRQ